MGAGAGTDTCDPDPVSQLRTLNMQVTAFFDSILSSLTNGDTMYEGPSPEHGVVIYAAPGSQKSV